MFRRDAAVKITSGATSHYWPRYLHNDSQSEWAAWARRSLKFCKMHIASVRLVTQLVGSSVVFSCHFCLVCCAVNDKQVLITGATNGIGLAAAEGLAALGANVSIVGRSKAKTRIASARITAVAGRGPTVATFIAGLSSQAAVRRLAAEVLDRYPKLDVLVNNASAMYGTRQLTKDGIELT